ncbi:hypothetical protein SUGI_0527900 [Cryptomeria japonica]|nr:hypothetical protein SUGI_0527900 [Cryptomeria japonica]
MVERNANFLWALFKQTKIKNDDWIRKFLDLNGYSEFASDENLLEWEEELKEIWACGGDEPEDVIDCFHKPKQIKWGKHVPVILEGADPSLLSGSPSLAD